jgi:hypothetical protein
MVQLHLIGTPGNNPFSNDRQIVKQIVALENIADQMLCRRAQHYKRHTLTTLFFERHSIASLTQQMTAAASRNSIAAYQHAI